MPYPEAARITCVSERTLKRMVEAGELREYEFRGSRRLSRAELLTPGPRHLSDRRQA
ncbi:excisionase family DNA-binding protein [Deinococcus malanensis]|uniref:excisionase family DNA-binding protein n=1 Tax=Deinococcus malanensis TaxID=1706855 RepID=UPI00362D7B5C